MAGGTPAEGEWGLMTAEDAGTVFSDRAETWAKVITFFPSFCSAVLRVWLPFLSVAHGHKVATAAPAPHLHPGRKEKMVAGVSHLLASLGRTGSRLVLGPTWNANTNSS